MDDQTTVVEEAEVLPPEGGQFALDWTYRAGQFLKNHSVSLTLGIAIGVLICYWMNSKK